MFASIINVFKVPELRAKILFTLGAIAVFRIGHWIPLPGVNHAELARQMQQATQDGGAFATLAQAVAMFSGGALTHSTIFGLGIMPYITAGIIFQLLATVYPPLKKLQEEGATGRMQIQAYTRYVTVALCIVQGIGWLSFLRQNQLIYPAMISTPVWWVMALACLTAGTVFLMWVGEQIDKHGIGNGASMIIMAGILAGMPQAINTLRGLWDPQTPGKLGYMGLLMLIGGFLIVVAGAVLITVAQRRITVQQAKHTRGRRQYGGQKSYLPLRINHGGVMPIVFASSLMIFPSVLFSQIKRIADAQLGSVSTASSIARFFSDAFTPGAFLYIVAEIALIYFFSYFWITVQFNPDEMSKQMKESGSFIPGLRPGKRTAEYLETVMGRITFVGAGFLAILAVLPSVFSTALGVPYAVTQFLGGTGLLIVVSVVMDFLQRIEANLMMRNYAGFLAGEDGDGPRMKGPRG